MTRQELGKKILGDDFDNVKFYNYFESQKSRKEDRLNKRIKNTKPPVEHTKKVTFRLYKKLIERGKTPNLDYTFFIEHLVGKTV